MPDPKKPSELGPAANLTGAELIVFQDELKRAPSSLVLQPSENLGDLDDPVTARANLLIVVIEESDYAALSPPDADTLYFIVADT